MTASPAETAACECFFSCADEPRTACSLSGTWHAHSDWPCPVHPHAPGDRPLGGSATHAPPATTGGSL